MVTFQTIFLRGNTLMTKLKLPTFMKNVDEKQIFFNVRKVLKVNTFKPRFRKKKLFSSEKKCWYLKSHHLPISPKFLTTKKYATFINLLREDFLFISQSLRFDSLKYQFFKILKVRKIIASNFLKTKKNIYNNISNYLN